MTCKTCASKSETEQNRARKRPGGSNVGKYKSLKGSVFAGPAGGAPRGSYPLTRNGRLSLDRAKSAIKLAHHAPRPTELKKFVANTLIKTKGNNMANSLGKKILGKLANKDTEKKWGGNKGDESSSKRDYANFKDTDKGYKSKASGEAHGDRSKSRRDYKRK